MKRAKFDLYKVSAVDPDGVLRVKRVICPSVEAGHERAQLAADMLPNGRVYDGDTGEMLYAVDPFDWMR